MWGGVFSKFLLGDNWTNTFEDLCPKQYFHTFTFSHVCNTTFPILILSRWLPLTQRKQKFLSPHLPTPLHLMLLWSFFPVVTVEKPALFLAKTNPFLSSLLLTQTISIIFLSLYAFLFHQCSKLCYFPILIITFLQVLLTPLVALITLPTPVSLISFTAKWLRKLWMLVVSSFF